MAFSNHTLVTNTESDHNGEHGIYFGNSGDYPSAIGNRSHHNAVCGIHVNGDLSQGGDGIVSFARIESNSIYENGRVGGAAINLDGATDGLILNNLLSENHAGGITLYSTDGAVGSSRMRIYNNTIVMAANSRDVITIPVSPAGRPNPTDNQILNNILYTPNSSRVSIATAAPNAHSFRSDFNVVVNRFSVDDNVLSPSDWQKLGHDAHSIVGNPAALFVSPILRDHHLRPGSPALHAGMSFPGIVDNDIEGSRRLRNQAWDIGAYAQ